MDITRIKTFLQVGLSAGGPLGAIVIRRYNILPEDYALYVQIALYCVTPVCLAWAWFDTKVDRLIDAIAAAHSDKLVAAVAGNPSVASVVVKNGSNGKIGAMAADPAQPKVMTEADAKEENK